MAHKKSHYRYLNSLAIALVCVSVGVALYYYLRSPLYNPRPESSNTSSVQGVSVKTEKITEKQSYGLKIHIPDGVYIRIKDALGRTAGYDVKGAFNNDIPYSEVVATSPIGKYIFITHVIAPEYVMFIEGKSTQESVLIDLNLQDEEHQLQHVAVDRLPIEGSVYRIHINPLSIELTDQYVE